MTVHCDTKKQADILLNIWNCLGYSWIYKEDFADYHYEPWYGYYFNVDINGRIRKLTRSEGRDYRLMSKIGLCMFAEFSDLSLTKYYLFGLDRDCPETVNPKNTDFVKNLEGR